jgi:acetyl-CoA carboxylase beta subunit
MNRNPFKGKQYATSKIYRARPQDIERTVEERPNVPQGIMTKCPSCGKVIYTKLLLKNYKRCDECAIILRFLQMSGLRCC